MIVRWIIKSAYAATLSLLFLSKLTDFSLAFLYRCEIIRGGMKEYLTPVAPTPLHVNPILRQVQSSNVSEWLVFEGISIMSLGSSISLTCQLPTNVLFLMQLSTFKDLGTPRSRYAVSSRLANNYHQCHAC
jgi:hypothetical protein